MTFFVISDIEECEPKNNETLYKVTYDSINTIKDYMAEVYYSNVDKIEIGMIMPIVDTRKNSNNEYITFEDEFYFDYETLNILN